MLRKFTFLICLVLCLTGCATEVKKTSVSFTAMDTYIKLTAPLEQQDALNKAKKYILALDKKTNRYDKNSEIYKINQKGGTVVSDDVLSILKGSKKYAEQTNGAFNPCLSNIIDLWKIGKDDFRVPKAKEIKDTLDSSYYVNLDIKGSKITLDNGAKLDLGGIAKGFACDKAEDILKKKGVTSALLDVGGTIGVIGQKEKDIPWSISLANPEGEGSLGLLKLENCFAATSGDYQRFSKKNGKIYCHIFDNTGKPVNNNFRSVTVVCDSAEKADAYSTALFVMGPLGAKRFYENVGGFEAIYVTKNKKIIVTPGLTTKFTLQNKEYTYEVQEV